MANSLRSDARAIWDAALAAVRAEPLVADALKDPRLPLASALSGTKRILVVGAGKAGSSMSAGVELALADKLDQIEGLVNVPAESVRHTSEVLETSEVSDPPPRKITLHAARPAGSNQPTAEGVTGTQLILELLASAGPDDVALCLLSGGGSALLPAPVEGVSLADKQQITKLLHACGATINEMNTVRKHISRSKGGGLARAFRGKALFSLIISDVIGDPLDVIASGPTAADRTTYADALAVLTKFRLTERTPAAILAHLHGGLSGQVPETLKVLPPHVHNFVLGNNQRALAAAECKAERLGYQVLNLGSFIEGETRHVAVAHAGMVRGIRANGTPLAPPVCLLSGGETTVTLCENHGKGGRNLEFVLAALNHLQLEGMRDVVVLSGGTDGEDGPTDAAGASADQESLQKAASLGLSAADFLRRNDAYHFFAATGDLVKTGLTQTNVMDVRVIVLR